MNSDFDNLLNNTHGFSTSPDWLQSAIQFRNPRVTIQLAHSQLYKLQIIDKVLNTTPLLENMKMGGN